MGQPQWRTFNPLTSSDVAHRLSEALSTNHRRWPMIPGLRNFFKTFPFVFLFVAWSALFSSSRRRNNFISSRNGGPTSSIFSRLAAKSTVAHPNRRRQSLLVRRLSAFSFQNGGTQNTIFFRWQSFLIGRLVLLASETVAHKPLSSFDWWIDFDWHW